MEEKVLNIRVADKAKLKFLYEKYRLQIVRYSLHIWFVHACLRQNLQPRFVKFRLYSDDSMTSGRIKKRLTKKWLHFELQKWYGRKNVATRLLMLTHLHLADKISNSELVSLLYSVDDRCQQERNTIRQKKSRKIEVLLRERDKSSERTSVTVAEHSFHARVINLSTTPFTDKEEKLLEKGLKYAVPPLNHNKALDTLVADLTVGLSRKNDFASLQCAEVIKQHPLDEVPRDTRQTIRSLQQKVKDNHLVVTKADKGNSTVVMDRSDYDDKLLTFIQDNDGKKIDFDICKLSVDVRRCIRGSEFIIPPNKKHTLVSMNPLPPRLYGLPKIHKPSCPIRPIVSFISSPTYHLCKHLDQWFKAATQFRPPFSVQNTIELVDLIKNRELPPNSTLVSFDVINLFTKVPLAPTIDHVSEILHESEIPPLASKEFLSLLNICLKQNVCKFRNEFYKFNDGLPMGSPIAPLLADVFMSRLEDEIFSSENPLTQHVAYWFRYVDDILCLWTGPTPQLHEFLSFINSFYSPIQFTLEIGGTSINFLDLTISLKNHKHVFEVFRKPTHTDLIIDGGSYHPPSHKHAAILSLIHRLVSLPLLPGAIAKETSIIKCIARLNNIDIDVDKLIRKKRIAHSLDSTTSHPRDKPKTKWIRTPFLGQLSKKLARVLKAYDLRPAYYSINRIRDIFPTAKDPIPLLDKSGVYKLECSDCPTVYIGQTGRKLRERVAEHEKAVQHHTPERSNFAAHLIDLEHSFSRDTGIRLLHSEGKGRRLTALEDIEIIKRHKSDVALANKIIPDSRLADSLYTVDVDITH